MIHQLVSNINQEISQKADDLVVSINSKLSKIKYIPYQEDHAASPSSYRPWIVLGGGSAAVGILGMIFSDSVKSWQILFTAIGTISAGYGFSKSTYNSKKESNIKLDYSGIKNFYTGKVEYAINEISKEWDSCISSKNKYLVDEITKQISDEKLRSKVLFKTYYLENIKISLLDFINALDNIPFDNFFLDSCICVRDKFAISIKSAILTAAKNQQSQYSEIVNILEKDGI